MDNNSVILFLGNILGSIVNLYLIAAYMAIWLLIGGYLLNIGGRLKKLERGIKDR